jgi:hypothetical protein
VFGEYETFFFASSGASAAFLGLLFVAFTLAEAGDPDSRSRERRAVLAGSAFLTLVDTFFVSITALTGGPAVFGVASLVMAIVGLAAASRLIPRAKRAGSFSRDSPTRTLNIMFVTVALAGYTAQLVLAIALLANTDGAALQRALVLMLLVLYASGLTRAWEVAGIRLARPADATQ